MLAKGLINMHSVMNVFNKYIQQTLFATLLAVFLPIHHSLADAYMDALQEEATELEYLDETRPGNAISTRSTKIDPALKNALSSINAFENYFRKNDSATATIYFRLTTQERIRIYRRFKSTNNFKIARNMVIEMFNKK